MIAPKELTPIAKRYNPDLLNKWLDAHIRQYSYYTFLSFKDKVLKAKNHPEWFLRLKNLTKKLNISLWNKFIDFCLGEAQKLNYEDFSIDFSGCTFENEEECDFSGIELPNIIFNNTTFTNEACFQGATFKEEANFESAKFKGSVNFKYTVFKDGANFENANFENEINFGIKNLKNINFKHTTFNSKINLQNKEFFNTSFERAIFKKTTNFEKATFEDEANFEKTTFEDEANFGNTAFKDKANFGNTTFEDGAIFENANFENEINFGIKNLKNINFKNTTFNSKINLQNKEFFNTSFERAIFKKTTNFEKATFEDSANFEKTTFKDEANFKKATFEDSANFEKTTFKDEANFKKATFQGEAIFKETLFETAFDKKIDFSKAIFKGVTYFTFPTKASNPTTDIYAELSFENATFEKETTFHRRKFFGDTSFIGAKFHFPPAFSPGEEYNPHLLNFTRTKLILSDPPQTASLYGKNIDSKKITRVRNLRKLAGQIKEYDFEIDLFVLERIMNSRINFKKWNLLRCLQQILIIFYWGLADYSRKAWLPAIWLLYSIVVLKDYLDKYVVKNSACSNYDLWLVSSSNAIPFFNKFSEKSKFILQRCFTDSDTAKNMQEIPNMVFVYFTIHGIFSIVMIFLFSLAIRNYFRIK